MNKTKVGVVIVTFNSQKYIERCLESILNNYFNSLEIVVVDNASVDQTLFYAQKFKKIKIIKNHKNLGFGKANNIGIKYLLKKRCDYLLLINPDTISSPSLLKKLVNVFEKDEKIAVAGCIITFADGKKIWFGGGSFNKLLCYTKHKFMNKSLNGVHIKSGYTDFITGACMMIDSRVIRKTGFLPEEYFLYFEDVFFCQKIIKKGFKCFLLAKPLLKHYVSTSTGIAQTNKITPLRSYFFARNPILYIKRDVSGYLKITNLIGQLFIRLPFYSHKFAKENSIKSFYYYLRGIADGLAGKTSIFFLNND